MGGEGKRKRKGKGFSRGVKKSMGGLKITRMLAKGKRGRGGVVEVITPKGPIRGIATDNLSKREKSAIPVVSEPW